MTWAQPLEGSTMGRCPIALVDSKAVVRVGAFESDHQPIADYLGHDGSGGY